MNKIKIKLSTIILIFLLILFVKRNSFAQLTETVEPRSSSYATEEVIIKYKPEVSGDERRKIVNSLRGEIKRDLARLNTQVVKTPNRNIEETIAELKSAKDIEYAEPNYIATAYEVTNDTQLSKQWGLYKSQVAANSESAWNYSHGNSQIMIAVLDTGIDQDHEDLKAKIVANINCTDSTTSDDLYGHGTHVAGIIAAATNNSQGIAGVGFDVALINAKGLGDSGSGYYSWIAECLTWAADYGARVINLSLGGNASSRLLEDAVNYSIAKGVTIVAAAGNSGSSSPNYPAYYPNVVSVAAIDSNDKKPSWSNFGNWVDVAAPGVSIYSTVPNHNNSLNTTGYAYLSGTSMATPFVSGIAALLASFGELSRTEIEKLIFENADNIEGTGSYWIHGRVNALQSFKALDSNSNNPTSTPVVPTKTPTPILTPTWTPTPSQFPSKTPTPTPTISIQPTPTTKPKNKWCQRYPRFCGQGFLKFLINIPASLSR